MLGILVHEDNHFIVRGPQPDRATALALVRHWTIIRIAVTNIEAMPLALARWTISTREFREDLQWAVIVRLAQPESAPSLAVDQLLRELAARAIAIHTFGPVRT